MPERGQKLLGIRERPRVFGREPRVDSERPRDTARSLRELQLPEALPEGTPGWLRPEARVVDLGDGRPARVTAAEAKALGDLELGSELRSGGEKPIEKPREIAGLLLLRSPESGTWQWISSERISDGAQVLNDNWVYKDEGRLEAIPRYPESREAIGALLRRLWNLPLVDGFGNPQPAKELVDSHLKANTKLNGWMRELLNRGETLSSAKEKVRVRALDELKAQVVDVMKIVLDVCSSGLTLNLGGARSVGGRGGRGRGVRKPAAAGRRSEGAGDPGEARGSAASADHPRVTRVPPGEPPPPQRMHVRADRLPEGTHQISDSPNPRYYRSRHETALRAAYERETGMAFPEGHDPHHIVPKGEGVGWTGDRGRWAAKAHEVLRQAGVGIDEGVNCVPLPRSTLDGRTVPQALTRHANIHTARYYERLYRDLSPLRDDADALRARLARIRRQILEGRYEH
jgi:hypothetical protein